MWIYGSKSWYFDIKKIKIKYLTMVQLGFYVARGQRQGLVYRHNTDVKGVNDVMESCDVY